MRALLIPGRAGEPGSAVMTARLARLGIQDVRLLARGGCAKSVAALADGISGRTLVVDCDLIVADASLGQLVDDPSVRCGALVGDPDGAEGAGSASAVRTSHRRVTSASSSQHHVTDPNGVFLGALVVAEPQADLAVRALREAAQAAVGWQADPVDVALVALVRAQVPMAAVDSVGPALRGGTADRRAAVQEQLRALDESRVLLERANRPDDGFYSTFVLRRLSKPVTSLALRVGLTPNQVSLISLAVGLTAAVCFAWGALPAMVVGALLMQASLIIDCVDGEVARFTRSFSELGAWLDASTDRVKEYAAYAGLAIGAWHAQDQDIWLLATVVMAMQTLRHVGDYDFSRVQRVRESWVAARPIDVREDDGAAGAGATLELSAQLNQSSHIRWAKKVLHMPIGERWLVLSVGAVLLGPRGTLGLLLGLGLLALTYTSIGRVLRSRRWRDPADRSGAWLLEPQRDLGPIGEPVWQAASRRGSPMATRWGWAIPALMRLVELGVVVAGAALVLDDPGAWLFGWVFVVAFHHYDTLYRALGGSAPPRWLVWGGLGWDGRTLLVLVGVVLGQAALGGLLTVGTLLLGALLVVLASLQWVRSMARKGTARA